MSKFSPDDLVLCVTTDEWNGKVGCVVDSDWDGVVAVSFHGNKPYPFDEDELEHAS